MHSLLLGRGCIGDVRVNRVLRLPSFCFVFAALWNGFEVNGIHPLFFYYGFTAVYPPSLKFRFQRLQLYMAYEVHFVNTDLSPSTSTAVADAKDSHPTVYPPPCIQHANQKARVAHVTFSSHHTIARYVPRNIPGKIRPCTGCL